MPEKSIQIAEFRGESTSIVTVEITNNKSVQIFQHDLGRSPQSAFGASDVEWWTEVKEADLANLAFALLIEKYNGDLQARSKFQDFCERHGIEHRTDMWT